MKNIYDNPSFFKKYSEMTRSKDGLEGAGEWESLKRVLPSFEGKTILDLGSGYGWHAKYMVEHGAKVVYALDSSLAMLNEAEKRNYDPKIIYCLQAMEEMDFPPESFDVIFSSLSFHYVEDLSSVFHKIFSFLKSGGLFIFSVEHPLFTTEGSEDWIYDNNGKIQHFPLDNYFYEGERLTNFLGTKVKKYHRTLTTYFSLLLDYGFKIERVIEPTPKEEMLSLPGMKDELRRPMMLIIRAKKD